MLTTIGSFLIVLMVLIFVHEFGHFIAAKAVGVKVEAFSLGFPPKLISKKIGETEYKISVLPLGGYVKLFGESPLDVGEFSEEDKKRSFTHKPTWAKMIVVLAGPIFNLIFAFMLFVFLTAWAGIGHLNPTLGYIEDNSPAQIAGLQFNDEVVSVAGKNIKYFDEIEKIVKESNGEVLPFIIKRGGKEYHYNVKPLEKILKNLFGEEEKIFKIGIGSRVVPYVGEVVKNKAAYNAGLKNGDLILSINGKETDDWKDVLNVIQGDSSKKITEKPKYVEPLLFKVKRGNENLEISIIPDFVSNLDIDGNMLFTPQVGMKAKIDSLTEKVSFFESIKIGFKDTVEIIASTIKIAVKLITMEISVKTLGGPILIAEVSGDKAREGILPLIALAAFISINLGVLNLLPLPVLDGGQFLIFLIEGIIRKPLSLRFMNALSYLGFALLVLLMITVFYNDINRLVKQYKNSKIQVEVIDTRNE